MAEPSDIENILGPKKLFLAAGTLDVREYMGDTRSEPFMRLVIARSVQDAERILEESVAIRSCVYGTSYSVAEYTLSEALQ